MKGKKSQNRVGGVPKKRVISVLLSLALVVGTLSALGVDPCRSGFGGSKTAKADTADMSYIDYNPVYDENGALASPLVHEDKTTTSAPTPVTAGDTNWGSASNETWYAVTENITNTNRIIVSGHVHLILCNHKTFTASSGITVTGDDNRLTIYAQSETDGEMGQLVANGNGEEYHSAAGIGGGSNDDVGSGITINGGKITATGGLNNYNNNEGYGAAGIGGGYGKTGSDITINGGIIVANGKKCSPGIGGKYASDIKINGGTITATSTHSGAGIGCGGSNGNVSNIIINGGTVNATGGEEGAGIGGGQSSDASNIRISGGIVTAIGKEDGAGIGGGNNGAASNIRISGGTVTATGGGYGAGIGGGNARDGSNIYISGGTVEATGGGFGAGIGGGNARNGSNIYISGGTVEATGVNRGAGIGGGSNGVGSGIRISGGTVTANGGDDGAGIGGVNSGSDIEISGGTVTANGGKGAAGIGGGRNRNGSDIRISGGTVNATGGEEGAGIGGGSDGGGSGIIISGGVVTAYARTATGTGVLGGAGIGAGCKGNGSDCTIRGGLVAAGGAGGGAGIGGGCDGRGNTTICIEDGTVYATGSAYIHNASVGGIGGAGIGGGAWTNSGELNITIKNSAVVSASGGDSDYNGAAIGSGAEYYSHGSDANLDFNQLYGRIYKYQVGETLAIMIQDTTHQSATSSLENESIRSFKLTLRPNNGTLSVAGQTIPFLEQYVKSGASEKLMANLFTNGDTPFMGWETTAAGDASGDRYSDEQENVWLADTTLYAQWRGPHNRPPIIKNQPSDLTLTERYTSTNKLSIGAVSPSWDALSYTWYSNMSDTASGGEVITGATDSEYTIPAGLTQGTYYYYCEVQSTRDTVTLSELSRPVTVVVNEYVPSVEPPAQEPSSSASSPVSSSYTPPADAPSNQPSLGNGLSGWSEIGGVIATIPDGGSLGIDMNGTITLPASAINSIQGRDVNLVLNMGGGIKWTINGRDVSGISGDVNLGVYIGTSGIPVEIINKLTGEREKINLMLSREGGPGFRAILTIPLKPSWAGQVANLFNYNKVTENMDFVSSGTINPDGSADLVIGDKQVKLAAADGSGQASSFYTIVIDDHSLDPNAKPEPTATPAVTPEPTAEPTPEPAQAQDLTLSATSIQGNITLSWNEQTEASRFRIYQLIDGRKLLLKTIVNKNSQNNSLTIAKAFSAVKKKKKTTYHRKRLKVGKEYTFIIRAYVNSKWTRITDASTATVKVK